MPPAGDPFGFNPGIPVQLQNLPTSSIDPRQQAWGWCHELNQLFAETLRVAGLMSLIASLGSIYRRPSFARLTHLVMVVTLDAERWLVDVGFGGPGPTESMPLAMKVFTVQGERFRIDHEAVGRLRFIV